MVKLNWFPNNDTNNNPVTHYEKANCLVPTRVQLVDGIIMEAEAEFPPISFLQVNKNGKIQFIKTMDNKSLYQAVRNRGAPTHTKAQRWQNIQVQRINKAFTRNHGSGCGAKKKQLRWQVLNHCLPVRQRLHKMNPQVEGTCALCKEEETILHCLYFCRISQPIWGWFKQLWERLTKEVITLTDKKLWICNDRQSKYSQVLAEMIDNIQYMIWIHRNEHTFRTHPIIPIQVRLIGVAQQLNVLIRSRDHLNHKRQDEGKQVNSEKHKRGHWSIIWQNITQLVIDKEEYKVLQSNEGKEQLNKFLHNTKNNLSGQNNEGVREPNQGEKYKFLQSNEWKPIILEPKKGEQRKRTGKEEQRRKGQKPRTVKEVRVQKNKTVRVNKILSEQRSDKGIAIERQHRNDSKDRRNTNKEHKPLEHTNREEVRILRYGGKIKRNTKRKTKIKQLPIRLTVQEYDKVLNGIREFITTLKDKLAQENNTN